MAIKDILKKYLPLAGFIKNNVYANEVNYSKIKKQESTSKSAKI